MSGKGADFQLEIEEAFAKETEGGSTRFDYRVIEISGPKNDGFFDHITGFLGDSAGFLIFGLLIL